MTAQYYFFTKLKQTCAESQQPYYESECITARRQMMDAQSFVVSFRRRGFELALQDLNVKRTIIEHDPTNQEVPVGSTYTLISEPIVQFETIPPESKWSSMVSR
jgi:hypothetical protein